MWSKRWSSEGAGKAASRLSRVFNAGTFPQATQARDIYCPPMQQEKEKEGGERRKGGRKVEGRNEYPGVE